MKKLDLVSAIDASASHRLRDLNERLMHFYNKSLEVNTYFERAHSLNQIWPSGGPQQALRSLIVRGDSVLDLGCGSGHAFDNLKDIGIRYVGVDGSRERIKENSGRCGDAASFISSSLYEVPLPDHSFNVVFSLYVLEHLVWPHIFLKEMVRLTCDSGHIVIICPLYRNFRRMPSLPFGGGGALSAKLKTLNLSGAARHIFYRWYWSQVIASRYPPVRFPWLINLNPSCLYEAWDTDKDAVYFVDRDECVKELGRLGAMDITSESQEGLRLQSSIGNKTCFIIAEKRSDTPPARHHDR